mmetsp:Transcript_14681/g.29685  ORF Transcript_14681/g.29685 Transcript_14681/m.29685 type:complete len:102 (-) Transcript_14681:77-382(-)
MGLEAPQERQSSLPSSFAVVLKRIRGALHSLCSFEFLCDRTRQEVGLEALQESQSSLPSSFAVVLKRIRGALHANKKVVLVIHSAIFFCGRTQADSGSSSC